MPYTTHYNLPKLATGAVDGIAAFNDALDKIEKGRTIKCTVGATTLLKKSPFYISTADGLAYKANSTTEQMGLWQSASNSSGTQGYGQIEGIMSDTAWNLGYGALLYVTTGSTLSTSQPIINQQPIAIAISSREVQINPLRKRTFVYKSVAITISSANTTGASAPDADLIGGILMGYYPTGNQDQFVINVAVDTSGSIQVTLGAAAVAANTFNAIISRSV